MNLKPVIAILSVCLLALCVVAVIIFVGEKPADKPGSNLNIVTTEGGAVEDLGNTGIPQEKEDDVEQPGQVITPEETVPVTTEGEGSLFDDEENDGQDGNGPTIDVDAPEKPTKPTEPDQTTATEPTEGEGEAESPADPTEESADYVIDFDDLLNKKP